MALTVRSLKPLGPSPLGFKSSHWFHLMAHYFTQEPIVTGIGRNNPVSFISFVLFIV
jgi:hypothetical protein